MINWHSELIETLVKEMRPKTYVELGVCGAVTLKRALPFVESAYACDISPFDKFIGNEPNLHKFIMSTDEFAGVWENQIRKPIDFIFIDADHSRNSVWKDVTNFLPWLTNDTGLMLLHDMWPPDRGYAAPTHCGDAYRLNNTLRNLADIEYSVLPIQFGIGVIRKPTHKDWRNNE